MNDDKEEKKAETEPEHTPDPTPDPTPPPPARDGLSDEVAALREQVTELTGLVTGIISTGGGQQDSTPVKLPWTHYGSKR